MSILATDKWVEELGAVQLYSKVSVVDDMLTVMYIEKRTDSAFVEIVFKAFHVDEEQTKICHHGYVG